MITSFFKPKGDVKKSSGSGGGGDGGGDGDGGNKKRKAAVAPPPTAATTPSPLPPPVAVAVAAAAATASATREGTPRIADGSVGGDKKQKKEGKKTTTSSSSSSSPYHIRKELLNEYLKSANTTTNNNNNGVTTTTTKKDEDEEYIRMESPIGNSLERAIDDDKIKDVCEIDELSTKEQRMDALNSLSSKDIDKYYQVFIIRRIVLKKVEQITRKLYLADKRNTSKGYDKGDVMLNTHSTWCMYPVIEKELLNAQKAINLATKKINGLNSNSNGLVVVDNTCRDAMETSLAVVIAIDRVDHWRYDTEDMNRNNQIYVKVSKLLKDLLWFTNYELSLGDHDPYTRNNFIDYLNHLSKEWKESYVDVDGNGNGNGGGSTAGIVSFKTVKNGDGFGRKISLSSNANANANANAKKKAPTLSSMAATASIATSTSTISGVTTLGNNTKNNDNIDPSSVDLIDFLKALPKTKLNLRAKTHVQLEIIDITTTITTTTTAASGKKKKKSPSSCHVVVSGAMDMKNLNQLVAYLTGQTQEYNYHSQKGKALKGSFFVLNHPCSENDNNTINTGSLTIGEKSLAKTVRSGRHVVDKDIKITQIFQGLITGPKSGIVYDSNIAKNMQLFWIYNKDKTYKVTCNGILPNKCLLAKHEPLPRVVNNVIGNVKNTKSSGFMNGQFLYKTNDVLRGDRKSPPKLSFGNDNKSPRQRDNENTAEPVVNADDGSAIQRHNDDEGDGDSDANDKGYDINDLMTKAAFEQKNIESAGLPTSPASGATS